MTVSCLFTTCHKDRSARTSAVHVSLSSDSIVKQQRLGESRSFRKTWAKSPHNLSGRTGLAPISTDQSLVTPEKSREGSEPRRPRQQRRRRWAAYRPGLVRVSTTVSKKVRKSSFSEEIRAFAPHKNFFADAFPRGTPPAQLGPRSAGFVRAGRAVAFGRPTGFICARGHVRPGRGA